MPSLIGSRFRRVLREVWCSRAAKTLRSLYTVFFKLCRVRNQASI
jgi:hypothetical protein